MKKCNSFSDLYGSESFRHRLYTQLVQGQQQTTILTGPKGIGKKTWADAIAAAFLCLEPGEDGACKQCEACTYFAHESHPDIIVISSQEGKNIPIDTIRDRVHREVILGPQISPFKVWILDASMLLESAQNALLKVLEEPPQYAKFILLVEDVSMLLPTLLSRAVRIDIPRLNKQEIEGVLQMHGLDDSRLELASSFAQGLPGLALEIGQGEQFLEMRNAVLQWFLRLPSHDVATLLTADFKFLEGYKAEINTLMFLLQVFVRDCLLLSQNLEQDLLMQAEYADVLGKFTKHYALDASEWSRISKTINKTQKYLRANTNFEMSICNMLLEIREEFTHARSN